MNNVTEQLREKASEAYCDYIDQLSKTECLGWEQKVKSGKFGATEKTAHNRAYKLLGKHVGYSEAAKMLEESTPWTSVEGGLPEDSITNQYRLWVFAQDDGKDIGFTGTEIHGRYFEGEWRGARNPLPILCIRVVAYQPVTGPTA